MDLKQFSAALFGRQRDVYSFFQSSPEGFVEVPGTIGGCEDDHKLGFLIGGGGGAIHLDEQFCLDSA
jgi:hypothetical protein